MGRGTNLSGLTAEKCEEIFEILYRVQKKSSFLVKITEAPHFRRFVAPREREEEGASAPHHGTVHALPKQLIRTEGPSHSLGLASQGVNSGNGFLFVSHTGEVFPSGFLPISAGSLREKSLAWLYRESEVFRELRRPDSFLGVCGHCEFNRICGGSRSRAFALLGSHLASDPWCVYKPRVTAEIPRPLSL